MRRVQSIRLGALVLLALAAVAIACGTLYVLITPAESSGMAIVPAAITGFGAAIMIGVALADIRYAARLERRLRERSAR